MRSPIIHRFSCPLCSWCVFQSNRLGGAGFWVRLGRNGPGIHIKDATGHVPLFSERNGYTKAWYVMGLRAQVLESNRTLV